MFEVIFLAAAGIYFLVLVFLLVGLSRVFPRQDKQPFISVIIAARNEEENILRCMESLQKQDYPVNNYEVIMADDFSTDNTSYIIKDYIKDKPAFRLVIPDANNTLQGKINALNDAVESSAGDILLFTDADCTLPSSWISTMVSYYSDKAGMVNSFSITTADNIISGMQSIDLVFLISVAAGMANNGYPASCIGNNMSVKREVYSSTGGYSRLPVSVTEDYALLNRISSLGKYRVIFPIDEKLLVLTRANVNIKELIAQKKRWAAGGLASPNISLFLMVLSYTVNLLLVLSFFFYSSKVFAVILFKVFSELLFLYQVHKQLKSVKNLKYFPLFEIYYVLYTLLLPVILLVQRKVIWKGRTY